MLKDLEQPRRSVRLTTQNDPSLTDTHESPFSSKQEDGLPLDDDDNLSEESLDTYDPFHRAKADGEPYVASRVGWQETERGRPSVFIV